MKSIHRLSSYAINIALNATNETMLIHGYTGAIDIVGNDLFQYLVEHSENIIEENFPFSKETWKTLRERGYLTNKSDEEEIRHVVKMADLLQKREVLCGKRYFGFIVSYNCNFRCPYCYESRISEFGNSWNKRTFTKEMVDEAYNAINKIEPRIQLHSRDLLLYGGEPLLKENRDVVEYIVNKGCDLGYHFHAITNGYNLENYLDLLNPLKIAQLQVTIDGMPQSHNKSRIHMEGKDTFEKIINNVALALQKDIFVGVRMNCNSSNIGEASDLKRMFEVMGLYKYEKFNFYCALTCDYLKDFKQKNGMANSVPFLNREDFVSLYKNNPNNNFEDERLEQKISLAINKGVSLPLSSTYCTSFTGSYYFDPFGKIYSCWERVGRPQFSTGEYGKGVVSLDARIDRLHTMNVGKFEKCRVCKFVFLCRGGCHATVDKHLCNIFPKLIEISANKAYSTKSAL